MSNRFSAHRFGSSKAFTLIELLVVIAIIAILAAILFPVFARARENARKASCMSNLKQMNLGIMQYTQDYDERFPNGRKAWETGRGWLGALYPYTKSVQLYVCPSDSKGGTGALSYGYNVNMNGGTGNADGNGSKGGVSLAQLNASAKTIMLFEVSNLSRGASYWTDPAENGDPSSAAGDGYNELKPNCATYATGFISNRNTNAATGCGNQIFDTSLLTGRHMDGANYSFADGHAKWLKGAAVSGGYNNSTSGNCGSGSTAANTDCSTIGATYSIS